MLDTGNPEKSSREAFYQIPNGSRLMTSHKSQHSFKMESLLIAMADLKAGIIALKYQTDINITIDFKRQYMRIDLDLKANKYLEVSVNLQSVNLQDNNLIMKTSNLSLDSDCEYAESLLGIQTTQHTHVNALIDIIIEILAKRVIN